MLLLLVLLGFCLELIYVSLDVLSGLPILYLGLIGIVMMFWVAATVGLSYLSSGGSVDFRITAVCFVVLFIPGMLLFGYARITLPQGVPVRTTGIVNERPPFEIRRGHDVAKVSQRDYMIAVASIEQLRHMLIFIALIASAELQVRRLATRRSGKAKVDILHFSRFEDG